MTEALGITSTFYRPCTNCGAAVETVDGAEQPHDCHPQVSMGPAIARAFWMGHDRAKQDVPRVDGSTSDGFHTFDELYQHRMLLNAVLFNEWGATLIRAGESAFDVHRSRLHHDGEAPFGGGWFVVVAQLPTGQISYHYPLEHWDLFLFVPVRERAAEWDGHTSEQVVERLQRWVKGDS